MFDPHKSQQRAKRREAALEKQKRADRLATINEEKAALQRDKQATRATAELVQVDRKLQAFKKARTAKKAGPATKAPARARRPQAAKDRSASSRSPR